MMFTERFFLLFLITTTSLCENDTKSENTTFRATNEWKTIEDGQEIPRGLHVRINVQSGKKEAKLLDPKDDKEKKSLLSVPDENDESQDDEPVFLDPEELKKITRNIKSDESVIDNYKEGKQKFRSYDELKQDFDAINMKVKTDIEIMTGLIENFKKFHVDRKLKLKPDNLDEFVDGELLTILTDLEYLVHQFDNAKEFARLGGFTEIIHKSLNSSNEEIRSEALKLHGSATQSNPKVQIAALESGSINLILKTLALDTDMTVRSRAIFALSCLLRQFPAAQLKLIKDGGLTVFALIFDKEGHESFNLQLKIITLIYDLIFERREAKMYVMEEGNKNISEFRLEEYKERIRQYKIVDLELKLVEQKWCSRISKWFVKQNYKRDNSEIKNDFSSAVSLDFPIRNQHDVIEKVVDTIFALSDICKSEFQSDVELVTLLQALKDIYIDLAFKEKSKWEQDPNQFFNSLANVLKLLTEKLNAKRTLKVEL